jgi:multidrug efflux pump subunit AcrA (membrane-fusion protein)
MTGSTRTIWIMAVTAVVSLAAGLGLSRLIVSPSEAAANAAAPEAGLITVPVEQRSLANDVVMRGDAIYEDPAQVMIETGDIGGPAVVTGQVPEVGATLDAGAVILEVAGRPVILLPGELPVYRTLRAGVSGPDVIQLKEALIALGIDPGSPGSNAYDAGVAAAIRELYTRVGYPAPTAGEEADAAVEGAREMVRSADEGVASAQRAVNSGGAVSEAEKVAAQGAVNDAQAALGAAGSKRDNAVNAYNACLAAPPDPTDPCTNDAVLDAEVAVVAATSALNTAVAALNELNAPRDISDLRAALTSAQRSLTDAREQLAEAQTAVITPLPASEVVYLTSTPRRVDEVSVQRGSMLAGTAAMSVSGATLQIAGTVSTTDADLIAEGAVVVITLPDGTEVAGTVQSVGVEEDDADAQTDANRERVVVVPAELTEEQRVQLQGANVRVTIPVSSTEGEVLAVPIAALTAGPGGESRVEVLDDGAKVSRLVTVETGLAAGGFVEVTPTDGSLEAGDQVVVGTAEVPEDVTDETDTDTEETDTDTTDTEDAESNSGTEDAEG